MKMRVPVLFARRYLFGKKTTNAINIITGISIVGISIGSAALILVLSVFNGFEDLLSGLMNTMNADLKILPVQGKTFEIDSAKLDSLSLIEGVRSVSVTLEETALIEYNGNQDFCTLKGVDAHYDQTSSFGEALIDGEFRLKRDDIDLLILGAGIANRLSVNLQDPFEAMRIYMPDNDPSGPLAQPFKSRLAYPGGRFSIKQDYDYQYIFCSIDFMQDLLEKQGEASAFEMGLGSSADEDRVRKAVAGIVGEGFVIKNRLEQDQELFKLMNVEKWMSYGIIFLTLLIVSFNLIGALWMIVLDKQKDIAILKSMGATRTMVRRIFLYEGLLITLIGIFVGFFLAGGFYFLQIRFGIISVPEGFVVTSYPMELEVQDFFVVLITVGAIGLLASLLPARRAAAVSAMVREE